MQKIFKKRLVIVERKLNIYTSEMSIKIARPGQCISLFHDLTVPSFQKVAEGLKLRLVFRKIIVFRILVLTF